MAEQSVKRPRPVKTTPVALPLHCPMPSMLLWNAHPRVFLTIEKTGEALCPYFGRHHVLTGTTMKAEG